VPAAELAPELPVTDPPHALAPPLALVSAPDADPPAVNEPAVVSDPPVLAEPAVAVVALPPVAAPPGESLLEAQAEDAKPIISHH
jgi:hypothetical protein